MRGLSDTTLLPTQAVISAVNIRRSFCGTPASARVSASLSSRPSALLSRRYVIGRPSGPTVGSSSREVNSGSSSLTGTSSGTSAVRAPPLGRTMVRFISGIALPPELCIQMRHLAAAGDIPAVLMVQRMADLTLHNATRVVAIDWLQTIWAAVLLVDCQVDGGPAAALRARAPRLAAHGPDGGSRSPDHRAIGFPALHTRASIGAARGWDPAGRHRVRWSTGSRRLWRPCRAPHTGTGRHRLWRSDRNGSLLPDPQGDPRS